MIKINFFFPLQMIEQLRKLSDDTGLSMAEHVRRAISDYLNK